MPTANIGAVIMVGRGGATRQERLVQRAVEASTIDLVEALLACELRPVVVAGPDLDSLPEWPGVIRDLDRGPFHFGPRLAELIERYRLSGVLYFGGGSTPLLERATIEQLSAAVGADEGSDRRAARDHLALTNNLHSSDWLGLSHAQAALDIIRQAPRDNSLAWMLQQSGRYTVRVVHGSTPAAGMDLDTPTDLALAGLHRLCSPRLRAALDDPLLERIPVAPLVDVIARDGSHLALIGRVAPAAWQALSNAGQSWIRVFSEERGMVASERLARGEVRTLLGRLVSLLGPAGFFSELGGICDAALIDSRVMMAATGHYPSDADRFASDLLLPEAVDDEWLRAFTAAAMQAPIPVVLGGHSLVAAGLFVLADVVAERRGGGR